MAIVGLALFPSKVNVFRPVCSWSFRPMGRPWLPLFQVSVDSHFGRSSLPASVLRALLHSRGMRGDISPHPSAILQVVCFYFPKRSHFGCSPFYGCCKEEVRLLLWRGESFWEPHHLLATCGSCDDVALSCQIARILNQLIEMRLISASS